MKDKRGRSPIDYARAPGRKHFQQLLRRSLGGPLPMLWQIFNGWISDHTSGSCCRRVERPPTMDVNPTKPTESVESTSDVAASGGEASAEEPFCSESSTGEVRRVSV